MKFNIILLHFVIIVIALDFGKATTPSMGLFLSGFEFCFIQIVEFVQNDDSFGIISIPVMRLLIATSDRNALLSKVNNRMLLERQVCQVTFQIDPPTSGDFTGISYTFSLFHETLLRYEKLTYYITLQFDRTKGYKLLPKTRRIQQHPFLYFPPVRRHRRNSCT